MMKPGAKKREEATYPLPSTVSEARRLELQARLYGGVGFLEPFLSRNPETILDVGCGTGHFTRHVAEMLPTAMVIGLDFDESRLRFAQSQHSADNLRYELGDMAHMPFEDGRIDLVFCRFVLVHDQDPTGVLREMARVTRPGGDVVAYDMIHEGIWLVPERPAFAEVLRTVVNVLRERGAEPNQGLHLAAGMRRVGLADVSTRAIAHHVQSTDEMYGAYRDNWVATLTSLGEELKTVLDAQLVQAALRELERVSGDELLVETTVLAWGRKR